MYFVADHAMFREGRRVVLDRQPKRLIFGEASDADSTVCLARALTPDVILMDLHCAWISHFAKRILDAGGEGG